MYLEEFNFSIWCDFIERDFLKNKFQALVEKNIVNGVTSNPPIFKEAILNSTAYKKEFPISKTPKEKYESLAIEDIRMAADVLEENYKRGDDGFVSIEIDPMLANDADNSIKEAKRLYSLINRENIMIKVPATCEAKSIVKELIKEGININVTLIFSPFQAIEILEAIKEAKKNTKKDNFIVMSIFVSRFDKMIDEKLPPALQGKVGIYNAAKIYNLIINSKIKNLKPLFASTSTKSDKYPPYYYVSSLIGENAINTAPLPTIEAFVKKGKKQKTLPLNDSEIDRFFKEIEKEGIVMKEIYEKLMSEGIEAFKKSFKEILDELK